MATRKDYEAIANEIRLEMIRTSSSSDLVNQMPAIERMAQRIAYTFAVDNNRFDFGVFYTACGLSQYGVWTGKGPNE